MSEYDYQVLWREVGEMQSWQIIAIAAACAEKIMPVTRYLGLPETYECAAKCTELAWTCATSERLDLAEASRLKEVFDALPELRCEYPDRLPFLVTQALSFHGFALATILLASSPQKAAENVGFSTLLDQAQAFDIAIAEHPEFRAGEPCIESSEKASQMSLVANLRGHSRPSQQQIESLREEARAIARLFRKALPCYAFSFLAGGAR